MTEPTYTCPNYDSEQVTVGHLQTFMVNTGEHWCHSIKTHDSDSPATCLECWWEGERKDLKQKPQHKNHD